MTGQFVLTRRRDRWRRAFRPDRETRDRILRAAASLFHSRGFESSSMKDIAEAAGFQKSSLYHYFPSKQELLYEILSHTVDVAAGGLRRIADSPLPARERLRLAVRHHIVTLVEDLDKVACLIEEEKALAPRFREIYFAKRDAYEQGFRKIVEDGIRTGEFRETDVRLAGFAVLGMCNWVVRWYRPDGPNTPEEIAENLGRLAVDGLSGDGTHG